MNSSARTWLAITGTCPGEEEAFVEATMVQERQLQVFFIDIFPKFIPIKGVGCHCGSAILS